MTVFSEFGLSAVIIKMDTYMQHINEMEGQYRQSELPRSKHRILHDVSHEQREICVSFEGQESFVTFDQYSQSSKEGFERQGYMPNREPISDVRSGNQVYDNRVPEKTGERVKPSLKKALANRFDSGNLSQIYKAQLKSRVRKSEESIPELAQEISRLVRFAYGDLPSSLREGIAKDAFIEALSDRELELVVFQRHPKSLQEAVQVALEYDAFRTTRQKRTLGNVREVL